MQGDLSYAFLRRETRTEAEWAGEACSGFHRSKRAELCWVGLLNSFILPGPRCWWGKNNDVPSVLVQMEDKKWFLLWCGTWSLHTAPLTYTQAQKENRGQLMESWMFMGRQDVDSVNSIFRHHFRRCLKKKRERSKSCQNDVDHHLNYNHCYWMTDNKWLKTTALCREAVWMLELQLLPCKCFHS